MRFAALLACLLISLLTAGSAAISEETYSKEDAKVLTLDASGLIQAKGLDGARAALHEEGKFRHGELYVNVIDMAGSWLVYPPTPTLEGRNVLEVKDATGKLLVQEIIRVAREQGEGWVDYRWMNPVTKEIGPKASYVKRVPGTELIVYVGIYL